MDLANGRLDVPVGQTGQADLALGYLRQKSIRQSLWIRNDRAQQPRPHFCNCRACGIPSGMPTRTKRAGATAKRRVGLLERLQAGPVICAEGYLFEFERRGYL